jgi:hypothetical protein
VGNNQGSQTGRPEGQIKDYSHSKKTLKALTAKYEGKKEKNIISNIAVAGRA